MKYRYYSTMRPVCLGTYPMKAEVVDIRNFDERIEVPEIGRKAWGYLDVSKKLDEADAENYDLVFDNAYEDKREIVNLLYKAVKSTRVGGDLVDLIYFSDEQGDFEKVTAIFRNGSEQSANVSGDSGIAMIRDIMKQIDF